MNTPEHIFVWTLRDVLIAIALGVVILLILYGVIDNWIDKRFRKKKKYYHKD